MNLVKFFILVSSFFTFIAILLCRLRENYSVKQSVTIFSVGGTEIAELCVWLNVQTDESYV